MSQESLEGNGDPLQVPLLSVIVKPPPRGKINGEELVTVTGESDAFWRETLIAVLCCCPFGLIAVCYSLRVTRWNTEKNYYRARKASLATERAVKFTYRFAIIFYLTLGILFIGAIEAGLVAVIDTAHTGRL